MPARKRRRGVLRNRGAAMEEESFLTFHSGLIYLLITYLRRSAEDANTAFMRTLCHISESQS